VRGGAAEIGLGDRPAVAIERGERIAVRISLARLGRAGRVGLLGEVLLTQHVGVGLGPAIVAVAEGLHPGAAGGFGVAVGIGRIAGDDAFVIAARRLAIPAVGVKAAVEEGFGRRPFYSSRGC
jgi:hypothetical protein